MKRMSADPCITLPPKLPKSLKPFYWDLRFQQLDGRLDCRNREVGRAFSGSAEPQQARPCDDSCDMPRTWFVAQAASIFADPLGIAEAAG